MDTEFTPQAPVIKYYVKQVYGNAMAYPIDYQDALITLTGRKTLLASDFKALAKLGCTFERVFEPQTEREQVYKAGRF